MSLFYIYLKAVFRTTFLILESDRCSFQEDKDEFLIKMRFSRDGKSGNIYNRSKCV